MLRRLSLSEFITRPPLVPRRLILSYNKLCLCYCITTLGGKQQPTDQPSIGPNVNFRPVEIFHFLFITSFFLILLLDLHNKHTILVMRTQLWFISIAEVFAHSRCVTVLLWNIVHMASYTRC